ncbi:hypothetical protein DPSP01_003174 [Paraphaeosphaeria sporulosa]
MESAAVQKRNPKKSAFSCEACRKRKVKCDANHPICNRCKAREDTCVYKLSPTLSYTQRLEQRVEQLQAALLEAQQNQTQTKLVKTDTPEAPASASESHPSPSPPRAVEALRIEADGRLSYHGSTSLFQLPDSTHLQAINRTHADYQNESDKESLVNNAWRERAYERLADIPDPFRWLLDSHFCWVQPLFNFVYRPAFTRDMKSGGPYFSQALLNAVLSHSVRWCRGEPGMSALLTPFENGAIFAKNAVRDLFSDVQHGHSKIPTVQALLLLSAQQCGSGNRTQAWLYSGMAFRLIDDMGICVDGKKYASAGHLSAEDIEIRNRLFWSCYFWDKLISLYFGRSPILQNSEISPPRVLMDDTAEIEPWTPHGLPSTTYRPKQAHSISCFIQMCALAEILNEILINLHNPSRELPRSQAYKCADAQSGKLRDWWRDLPEHLKINVSDAELECPPSHIVTLNCLFHTINILTNRAKLKLSREPDLAGQTAEDNPLVQCMSSATSIITLFNLYTRTFGDGHVVLSLAYSVYTAASIFLLEVQALGQAAPSTLERLAFCVGALDRLRVTSPVIATASDLIARELTALGIHTMPMLSSPSNPSAGENPSAHTHPGLPLPMDASTTLNTFPTAHGPSNRPGPTASLDNPYLGGEMDDGLGFNLLDMSSEMYSTFSQIEPISVTMNPGFDIF